MSDESLYCAVRIESVERPGVPSVTRFCSECGHKVWIAREMLAEAETMIILCVECGIARVKANPEGGELRLHPKQVGTIARGLDSYQRRN